VTINGEPRFLCETRENCDGISYFHISNNIEIYRIVKSTIEPVSLLNQRGSWNRALKGPPVTAKSYTG
jgi:hypothetical protein